MVNYKVTNYQAHISKPTKQTADVVEVTTGQTIKNQVPVQEARELCRGLNFGAGFDGLTPAFFLKKVQTIEFDDDSFYK
jgi:hypothetical protein